MTLSRRLANTGKREWPVWMMTRSISSNGASMSSRSMCVLGTMTSPAVMSAMRITPSSIIRDSGSISSLCSASASDSISWSRESGPGARRSRSFLRRGRFSVGAAALSAPRGERAAVGSDMEAGARPEPAEKQDRKLTAWHFSGWSAPVPLKRARFAPMWHARVRGCAAGRFDPDPKVTCP